jgi:hypothetical protein
MVSLLRTVFNVFGYGNSDCCILLQNVCRFVQEGGAASRILQKVEVPIVSADRCRRLYGSLPDHQICAGYCETGGRDSCQVRRHRVSVGNASLNKPRNR